METEIAGEQSKKKAVGNSGKEPAKKPEKFEVTDLRTLGPRLPIPPTDSDGKPLSDVTFTFNEWDMETEEHLAELKRKANHIGHFTSQMLGVLLADFCGSDFQKLTKEEKILKLSQLDFSNVMYMYIYLRYDELGEEIKFDITCPVCRRMIRDFVADLGDLQINAKDPKQHAYDFLYELKRPIIIPEQGTITKLKFRGSKWEAMEKADVETSQNAGKMKKVMFKSSLIGAEGEDGPLKGFVDLEFILKRMKKIDFEMAMRDVVENNAGPAMLVKGKCPHCTSEWFRALDWTYDSFFDSSSL